MAERLEERVVLADDPVLGAASYSYSVNENATSGTALGTVTATDPNAQPVTFSFGGSYSGKPFSINETTGIISLNRPLDFEVVATYTLDVYAIDPDGNFSSSPVTITVNDVSGDPLFTPTSYSFSVNEDEAIGFLVGSVSATGTGTLSYQIEGGNGILNINPATGQLSLLTELNYEELPSFNATVYATDGSGLSASASVSVAIQNIDETPDANLAPTLTGLSFSVTTDGQGAATGILTGTISDDYLTDGEFVFDVDVWYDYAIEATEYTLSSAISTSANVELLYGTTQVAARLTEIEAETGRRLTGDWFYASITVNPPANFAPTLQTFVYTPGDEGYDGMMASMSRQGYITAIIADPTRLHGAYKIEYDTTGDDFAEDSCSFPLDATRFAFEFRGSPNTSYSTRFCVIEYDYNKFMGMPGYELIGAWQAFTFTVPDFVNTPPDIDAPQSSYLAFGYGMGMGTVMDSGSLNVYLSDYSIRANTTYVVEVDFDANGSADFSAPVTSTSAGPTSVYIPSGGPTGPTTIRVRVSESNPLPETVVSPWVEVAANSGVVPANQLPNFGITTVTSQTVAISTLTGGAFPGGGWTVTATDPEGQPIKYSLYQTRYEENVWGRWFRKVPVRGLAINETNGQITIADADAVKAMLDETAVIHFSIRAFDGKEERTIQATVYDDHAPYVTAIGAHISQWALSEAPILALQITNMQTALANFMSFSGDLLSLKVAGSQSYPSLDDIRNKPQDALKKIILKAAADKWAAGDKAIQSKINERLRHASNGVALHFGAIGISENAAFTAFGLTLPADQAAKTLAVKAYLASLQQRLPIRISVPPTDPTFAALVAQKAVNVNVYERGTLLQLAHAKGWTIRTNSFNGWHAPGYADWPWLDATDIAVKLNSLSP